MRLGVRVVVVVGVMAVVVGGVLLSQVGAGPDVIAEPGLEEATKVLDCAAEEGVFSYFAVWGEGAGFSTPAEALKGILVGKDFGVSAADFVEKDVQVGAGSEQVIAMEFTAMSGENEIVVTWAMPVEKGWLADSVYGCTLIAD